MSKVTWLCAFKKCIFFTFFTMQNLALLKVVRIPDKTGKLKTCLPSKHEALGLVSRSAAQNKVGVVTHTYNPNTSQIEAGGVRNLRSSLGTQGV